ncbi:helix-turn-helix domain-containing protein [Azospirillum sp. B21]|nr:helix-turn-helix domain-containing protein [Azospirillum sp. B21]
MLLLFLRECGFHQALRTSGTQLEHGCKSSDMKRNVETCRMRLLLPLLPDTEQADLLTRTFGDVRVVYTPARATRETAWA